MTTGSVFSRAVLSTSGMAVQGIARFLYTLAIGRMAGPDALGEANTVLSIAVYCSLVLPAGLGVAGSRYLADPALGPITVGLLRRWFWGSASVLSVISVPIAYLIVDDIGASIACAFLVFAYSAYVFTRGAIIGEDRILRATIADFVSSLIAITALIAVLLGGLHWALLIPLMLGYVVFSISCWPRTPQKVANSAHRSTVARFLRDSTISALATGGLLPSTMIFVQAYDATQAGLFAAALSLATPASLVSQAANQVLIPHFARIQSDPTAARRAHVKALVLTTAGFAVVFGALIALSPWILTFFYGAVYADGTRAMQVLLVIVFLISITCAPSAYLVASGRQRQFAMIWLVSFVVGTITMVIAAPHFGVWGALLGFTIGGGGGSLLVVAAGLIVRTPEPVPSEIVQIENE